MILLGDCLERLKELPDNSVDSVVTDPPYGLSFMGKRWDYDVPSVAIWLEASRVLKPGGHLLAFGGTRTYHRLACNIEDAGFDIRDQIMWLYGSGFPKSHDISKGIDKAAGAEREVVGKSQRHGGGSSDIFPEHGTLSITAPSTAAAKQWQGWGSALKPSNEPVVLAMKPLTGACLLDSLAHECQSKLLALIAKKYSKLSPVASVSASSIAQWIAEKNTHTQGDLSDQMVTLRSESEKSSVLNTELSWLNILAEISEHANTFTTEMASSLTTDLKILSYFLSSSTQANTIPEEIGLDGQLLSVLPAENLFLALKYKLGCILTPSVHENAIAKDDHSKSLLDERVNNEPIVLARKPLSESTLAKNVLRWGVGGLNIDVTRIWTEDKLSFGSREIGDGVKYSPMAKEKQTPGVQNPQGRWPANLLLGCLCASDTHEPDCAVAMLDEQSGHLGGCGNKKTGQADDGECSTFGIGGRNGPTKIYDRGGGASRFFYCAKSSKAERNAGLDGMPEKQSPSAMCSGSVQKAGEGERLDGKPLAKNANHHPTVKPLKLMEYLIKLVTPPGGTVLDPFMGSGSTGVAAFRLGFKFIGCEMNEEYCEIAKKRIEHAAKDSAS